MDILCTDKTGTSPLIKLLNKILRFCRRKRGRSAELAYLNSLHQTGVNNILDQDLEASKKG